jgi:hypothetical protein
MYAANKISRNQELEETHLISINDKLSLLKTKALYGANASGKSNIFKALSSFVAVVVRSVRDEKVLSTVIEPFRLNTEALLQPTFFQLTFIYNDIRYRYGFEATREKIVSEWLYGSPGKREVMFFERDDQDIRVNANQFAEAVKVIDLYKQSNNDIARPNALFLTAVRSFNEGLAKEIVDYISSYIIISGISDYQLHLMAEQSAGEERMREKMLQLLRLADVGIEDIVREEQEIQSATGTVRKQYFIYAQRKGVNHRSGKEIPVKFSMFSQESEGTKKIFELSPALITALEKDRVIVIDEFDARLHPLMSRKIIELFHSPQNKRAQLIIATHDTNFLSSRLLRRDQICFVERDFQGASHYYSLAEFKAVRNDASFEKDYIAGKYGAVPFLGDFNSIFEKD